MTRGLSSWRGQTSGCSPENRYPEPIDIATVDVSFISLGKVIPTVLEFLGSPGEILALVKPQFEVGKGEVGKGGIVRDEEKRLEAVDAVMKGLALLPLRSAGVFLCPVPGQKGNREYFIHLLREVRKHPP